MSLGGGGEGAARLLELVVDLQALELVPGTRLSSSASLLEGSLSGAAPPLSSLLSFLSTAGPLTFYVVTRHQRSLALLVGHV